MRVLRWRLGASQQSERQVVKPPRCQRLPSPRAEPLLCSQGFLHSVSLSSIIYSTNIYVPLLLQVWDTKMVPASETNVFKIMKSKWVTSKYKCEGHQNTILNTASYRSSRIDSLYFLPSPLRNTESVFCLFVCLPKNRFTYLNFVWKEEKHKRFTSQMLLAARGWVWPKQGAKNSGRAGRNPRGWAITCFSQGCASAASQHRKLGIPIWGAGAHVAS